MLNQVTNFIQYNYPTIFSKCCFGLMGAVAIESGIDAIKNFGMMLVEKDEKELQNRSWDGVNSLLTCAIYGWCSLPLFPGIQMLGVTCFAIYAYNHHTEKDYFTAQLVGKALEYMGTCLEKIAKVVGPILYSFCTNPRVLLLSAIVTIGFVYQAAVGFPLLKALTVPVVPVM